MEKKLWIIEATWGWCNENHVVITKSSTRPDPKSWAEVEDLTNSGNPELVTHSTSRFTIDGEVDEADEPVITVYELL